jgi:hypothetical protein
VEGHFTFSSLNVPRRIFHIISWLYRRQLHCHCHLLARQSKFTANSSASAISSQELDNINTVSKLKLFVNCHLRRLSEQFGGLSIGINKAFVIKEKV